MVVEVCWFLNCEEIDCWLWPFTVTYRVVVQFSPGVLQTPQYQPCHSELQAPHELVR